MREPGQTFALADIGFIDFEAKGEVDIDLGTYRYMASSAPLILAVAVGEAPAMALPLPLSWVDLPPEIHAHHARVEAGDATWAAWNAGFDREVWNQTTDFPLLDPEYIIDVMAQSVAAGLPGALDAAGAFSGCGRKASDGKDLIKLFCLPGSNATSQSHPDEWRLFLDYAANDVELMREIFNHTLQLPFEDWEEYWANERINLQGISFDQHLAHRAAQMATADRVRSAWQLHKLTDGAVTSVTKVKSMITWLQTVLRKDDQSYLVRTPERTDEETGEITTKEKLTLDREHINLLTVMLKAKEDITPQETKALRLLDIRQYGGSTTPAKFSRMLDMHVDGLLHGQFVFNGASQTGRFSSRGIQLHNLMRDALAYEMDAIDALRNGCDIDTFEKIGDDTATSRKLSMLIRPTLIPEDINSVFVWGDWSQIEARTLPWVAGAQHRLDIFREVDADPKKPDLYVRSAAGMSGISIAEVTEPLRQRGKVAELACQFGGGKNALQRMAANYNMYLDDTQAQEITNEWRAANPWAVDYWADLWDAFLNALNAPGSEHSAGLITYIFLKDYLGGTMLCRLPCGRMLTYRRVKWERVDEVDDKGTIIDSKWELTFARAFGRIKLWPGILAENVAQATAASVLRGALVRIVYSPSMPMPRAHTHDEILLEVNVDRAEDMAVRLIDEMERAFEWSTGLPIKAESKIAYSYTKCKAAQGL